MRKAIQQSWRTSGGLCQGKNSPSELEGMRERREIMEKRKMSVKVRRKEGEAGGKQEAAVQMEGIR